MYIAYDTPTKVIPTIAQHGVELLIAFDTISNRGSSLERPFDFIGTVATAEGTKVVSDHRQASAITPLRGDF